MWSIGIVLLSSDEKQGVGGIFKIRNLTVSQDCSVMNSGSGQVCGVAIEDLDLKGGREE